MTRVLVACITQETNTFCTLPTTRSEFEKQGLFLGDAVVDAMAGTGTVTGGFIEAAREQHWEIVPVIFAYALPGGTVERTVFDEFVGTVLRAIDESPGLDGILLHLHGATVAGGLDDPEGAVLGAIRARIGPSLPLVCCLDLHANVSRAMVENATVIVGYDTYPHVDFYDRGYECGQILARILRGELRPQKAFVHPPLLPPLQRMVTSTPSNLMARLIAAAYDLERDPRVVDVSVFGGFPYADVPDAGFSVVVTTNDDAALARALAWTIADASWTQRDAWLVTLTPARDAIREAMGAGGGTFVLADVADSQGGGTAGDGTAVLRALIEEQAKSAAVAQIADPDAVRACIAAGIGAHVRLTVGGKTDDKHGSPVEIDGRIRSITEGRFVRTGVWQPGTTQVMGRTAVVDCDGIEVLLTEFRTHPVDLGHFRSQGIEPTQRRILVLKSAAHFRANFEPIARKVIEVDAPGITHPDLRRFDFRKLPRPIYPLDPIDAPLTKLLGELTPAAHD